MRVPLALLLILLLVFPVSAQVVINGFGTGGGGGVITGSGTANQVTVWSGASTITGFTGFTFNNGTGLFTVPNVTATGTVSVTSRTGTAATAAAFDSSGKLVEGSVPLGPTSAIQVTYANASVTGTTTNRLVKITGDPPTGVILTTGDTVGAAFGICVSGCGTTGSGIITIMGFSSCEFDGSTTALNYVIVSTTTAGKCHDGGSSYPSGVTVLGRVQSTNVGAGTYAMTVYLNDVASATAGGNGRGTTVTVNGSNVSSNNGDLNDTTPAAAASHVNVTWQKVNGNPSSISAQVAYASPLSSSAGSINCPTCTTSAASLTSGQLIAGAGSQAMAVTNLTGDVTTSGGVATTISTVNKRRVCTMRVGADNGPVLVNADLGPQGRECFIPAAATIVEVDVSGDAGTPNVIPGRNRAGTIVNIVSSALATASAGGIACSNTGGTTGIDGATTCSATLQNTGLNAGDYLELVSGTAGGTAKRMSIFVTYTIN